MIALGPGALFNVATALALIGMGVAVLAVRPSRSLNRAFFVWSLGYGSQAVHWNLWFGTPWFAEPSSWWFRAAMLGVYAVGLVWLALVPPVTRRPRPWRKLAVLAIVPMFLLVVNVAWALASVDDLADAFGAVPSAEVALQAQMWAYSCAAAAVALLAVFAATRARQTDDDGARELSTLSIATMIWPASTAPLLLGTPELALGGWITLASVVCGAAAWILLAGGRHARRARDTALLPLALALVGYLITFASDDPGALVNAGFFGLSRLVSGGLLAFAIIRHQILGFDVRVRRGIKGSTVAALFFSVFFVVSESAAQIFSSTRLGPFVGIAAAGVLVFFLAPLHRWADRIAGSATFDAKPLADQDMAAKERTFHRMATAAWADGVLSRDERRLLDQLADELGLSAARAKTLEAEASK